MEYCFKGGILIMTSIENGYETLCEFENRFVLRKLTASLQAQQIFY